MNYNKPIEIAPKIYWIGYVIPNDPFQCHVYLIEDGEESILIDPGSMITFPVVLDKITQITSLKNIKYIILHHQDPDIVSSVGTLEKIIPPGERYIVTHWRTELLLKHYQWKTPFYLVDKNDWKLKTKNFELEFVFTPYAHFPGAFCTYEKKNKILFSSDLFGGLTPDFQLFAKDVNEYFEYAKLFHTHYIPSKDILRYTMKKIEKLDINLIAPQHGSIIPKNLIKPLIKKLKNLDCGLYLLDDYYDDIYVLNKVDNTLKEIFKNALINNKFENLLKILFDYLKKNINNLKTINIITDEYSYKIEENEIKLLKSEEIIKSEENNCKLSINFDLKDETKKNIGKIFICYENELSEKELSFLKLLFKQLSEVLGVATKKEINILKLKEKEKNLYEMSITDPLTGLYNRTFLIENLEKKILEAKRYNFPLSIAMIDVDYFKKVNDTYGHLTGDCLLKELSFLLKKNFRGSDTIARYGGEEFLIIMPFTNKENAKKKLEKFRKLIENYKFCTEELKKTISIGIAEYSGENVFEFINKADQALYKAKNTGRNKIIIAI